MPPGVVFALTPTEIPAIARYLGALRAGRPIALLDEYDADAGHMRAYARAARTEAGFQSYLAEHVMPRPAAAA